MWACTLIKINIAKYKTNGAFKLPLIYCAFYMQFILVFIIHRFQERKWGSWRLHKFIKFTEVWNDRPGIQTFCFLFCFNKKPKPFSPSQVVVCLPPSVNMTFISEWGWFLPPWNIYHLGHFSLPQLWDASSLWCVEALHSITSRAFAQQRTAEAKMSVVLRLRNLGLIEKQSFHKH